MSDIKVINIKDSSFKMWDNGSKEEEENQNLFESSTMSGGSRNSLDGNLDLFEDNMSMSSSFSHQSGGSKKNKSESETKSEGDSDSKSETKSDKDSESETKSNKDSDNESETKTKSESDKESLEDDESLLEELSSDPLMIVLGNFLISRKGNNIADILEDIRDHLAYIRHHLSEANEAKSSTP